MLATFSVATMDDDLESWKDATLTLDGFRYERLSGSTATDSVSRLAWLDHQRSDHLGQDFRPQPWDQLISVLREMGYLDEAKAIAIEKQKRLRRTGKIHGVLSVVHGAYGLLYGYGYRPLRLTAWVFGIALVFAVIFWFAAEKGVMAPTDRRLLFDDKLIAACQKQDRSVNWTKCNAVQDKGVTFSPMFYSLELLLPIVGWQQSKDWAPLLKQPCADVGIAGICYKPMDDNLVASNMPATFGHWPLGILVSILARLENLFGWIAGLMFVGVVSGFVKKD